MHSCSEYLKQLQLPVAAVLSESSNAMLSVWSEATGSAGSSTAPLLQSTANIHVIFVNLDWKRSRHDNEASIRRNTTKLADTASSIVTSMRPAVICCCEVGEASNPMTKGQMLVVADTIRRAWEASATEHPAISFLFEEGAPYLTIWDGHQCKCSHGRILEKVYDVLGHQRNAQAFLCTMPGESDEECIDVVNVHAPSGKKKLTDAQRYQLILNLLQSSSTARAGTRIGESKFLIGGDMNTTEICFSQILNKLRILDILKARSQLLFPMWGQPGDMCVVGGFTATVVLASARNHDHQHTPYGIAWQRQPQHATEQLTTMPQTQIPTVPEQRIPTPQKPIPIAPGTKNQSASAWPATEQPDTLLSQLRNAYFKCDKYRDACVAAQGWLSNSLRGSMAIDALLQQPGSAPLKEVLGPALEGQLADVATGQAMLELLIHLQTEADMERASAATEHSDPAGVELAPADADEWDVGLAPVDEDEWDVGLAPADAHEPNGDAVADADADASGAAPAGFAAEPDRPDEPDADVGQARWVQGDNRLWTKRNGPNGLAPCQKLPLGPPPPRLLVAAPDGPSDFEQHFFGGPFWAPRA